MNDNIPKIIFIVPYRNRKNELIHFSLYMNYIMEDYKTSDFEIYYSHQNDEKPFNRGACKNIGFLTIKDKYPNHYKNITFVFNDIDTLPFSKNILNYETQSGVVKHFYGCNFALGGIFSITGEDFENCNGFPNIWGWGLEDNAMNDRVLAKQILIDRKNFYALHNNNIIQLNYSPYRLIDNRTPKNYINKTLYDNLDTINEIDYKITSLSETPYLNSNTISYNQYIIDINNFRTLVNPNNKLMYNQNTFYDSKLHPNVLEKLNKKPMIFY